MAILTSKDRKKLRTAAKKKKNTDTGRTSAEKQRKQSVSENAAASKKKNNSSVKKKTTTSSSFSVLNDTEKKEVEEIRRRTQSLRDRNTAVSQRDAYDSARRQAYGEIVEGNYIDNLIKAQQEEKQAAQQNANAHKDTTKMINKVQKR